MREPFRVARQAHGQARTAAGNPINPKQIDRIPLLIPYDKEKGGSRPFSLPFVEQADDTCAEFLL